LLDQKLWVLVFTILASTMPYVDESVGQRRAAGDERTSPPRWWYQWLVNAYTLSLRRCADRRRRRDRSAARRFVVGTASSGRAGLCGCRRASRN